MTASLITNVCERLEQRASFVMATIISHTGSTPRISGTCMIIAADGTISGTIGGGLLEARVMEKAREMMRENVCSVFMPFDLTHPDVAGIDMICGGKAEIFLEQILPSHENLAIFTTWKRILEQRADGFFLTAVSVDRRHIRPVAHAVCSPDHVWHGRLPVTEAVQQKIREAIDALQARSRFQTRSLQTLRIEDTLLLVEPARKPEMAFLCGAGHVARPTAHLCALTGFYVTVLDDRREFANRQHFPDAREIHVLESFEEAFTGLVVDEAAFVVIFTRGHLHDLTVLAAALKTQAGYIGMIGSRRKRDSIYRALLDMGYRQADLERVFSPIGLAIGAQSPEEIAVSIVAEMIQQRAQRSK